MRRARRPVITYILKGHTPVPYPDGMQYMRISHECRMQGKWRVRCTTVGHTTVSTVFLGLDHSGGFGPPQLFETMVGGEIRGRCATWKEAEAMHAKIVQSITS